MSEFISWVHFPPIDIGAKPTLAELRAKVTEAEAHLGRLTFREGSYPGTAEQFQSDKAEHISVIRAARAALRKAEEAERKPRLASSGDICGWAMANPKATQISGDLSKEIVRITRADMMTAIRRLPTYSCRDTVLAAVLLSDIEALVREAGE